MSNYAVLFDLIGALARRRHQVGERSFASLGLNHTEARLLTLLDREGGTATQDALSSMLSIDRSNAGRGLKRLEQEGYVVRGQDRTDARTRSVEMTAKGRNVAAEISRLREEMAERFFGDLSEEHAGAIVDLLRNAMDFEEASGARKAFAASGYEIPDTHADHEGDA